jgi:hypothetical protein
MKDKYDTHVKPHLKQIEAWCRDGVSEKKIAENLGVAYSSFREYKKKYSALSALLARTKDYVDLVEMVGAYKKRAEGYDVTETKKEYAYIYNPDTNETKKVLVKETKYKKHVPGDPRAMENWLRIRQSKIWGDSIVIDDENESRVILIPERKVLLPGGENE